MNLSMPLPSLGYQYNQLRQYASFPIRLLTVQPGETTSISCRLSESELHSEVRPQYKALSYTWGTDTQNECILIDGQAFPVRRNLRLFLKRLQRQDQPVLIWIDAICINQSDVVERNQQVKIMDHIYVEAEEVIAWLGDDPRGVARVLRVQHSPESADSEVTQNITSSPLDWNEAISDLVSRPYWRRAWIVQELLLAKHVVLWFGRKGTVDLRTFGSWYKAAQSDMSVVVSTNLDQILAYGTVRPKLTSKLRDLSVEKRHLMDLLVSFADTECSDPRDKVYAFLGLQRMSMNGRCRVVIDYREPPAQLYFDVLECCEAKDPSHKSFSKVLQRSLCLSDNEVRRPPRLGWKQQWNRRFGLTKKYAQRYL